MIRTILIAVACLSLGACDTLGLVGKASTTTVPQQAITDARTTVYGLKNAYGLAVVVADEWAKQPRCGVPKAPPAPLCSTAAGTVAAAKAQLAVASALSKAETVVLEANPQQSELNLAVASAQAAWQTFQTTMQVYGIKPETK